MIKKNEVFPRAIIGSVFFLLLVLFVPWASAQEHRQTPDPGWGLNADGAYGFGYGDKSGSKSQQYQYVDFVEFQLDIDQMRGEKVRLVGYIPTSGLKMNKWFVDVFESSELGSRAITGVADDLSREDRRYLVTDCKSGCSVTVFAQVGAYRGESVLLLEDIDF